MLPTDTQPIVTLTAMAITEVQRLLNVQGFTTGGLRLGVKGGGCSGLSYTTTFDEHIGPHDHVHTTDGVTVLVDPKSAIYLQDAVLDYQRDLLSGRFVFRNPQADKTCGCGESFSA